MGETSDTEEWGLCAHCVHAQRIRHPRGGGAYCICALAETDSRFDRYPRMPVFECPGFTPREPQET